MNKTYALVSKLSDEQARRLFAVLTAQEKDRAGLLEGLPRETLLAFIEIFETGLAEKNAMNAC